MVVMRKETSVTIRTGHRDDSAQIAAAPRARAYRRPPPLMPHLEEIAYDLGRAALADQESLVSGIRSRTGTLIATQALVASFLGGAALDRGPLGVLGWLAIAALVIGLGLSVMVLAPWQMSFALDVGTTYAGLREKARDGGSRWLVTAGLACEELRHVNRPIVRLLETGYLLISIATMVQLLLWIAAVALR
jgi:hypothetical protein